MFMFSISNFLHRLLFAGKQAGGLIRFYRTPCVQIYNRVQENVFILYSNIYWGDDYKQHSWVFRIANFVCCLGVFYFISQTDSSL